MTTLQNSVAWTMPNNQVTAKDVDVVQGRIFWLPAEGDLPRQAVKRARGAGVVEGIYGHPVVVVSRPAEDSHIAHFQVVSNMFIVIRRCR